MPLVKQHAKESIESYIIRLQELMIKGVLIYGNLLVLFAQYQTEPFICKTFIDLEGGLEAEF